MRLDLNHRITNLYDVLLSILLLTLTISTAIPNIILGALIVIYIYRVVLLKEVANYKQIRKAHTLLIILVVYFAIDIYVIHKEFYDYNIVLRFLIFIVLPVLIQKGERFSLFKLSFISGVNIGLLFSLILIGELFLNMGIFSFGNTQYVNQTLIIERPYLGFMCTLSAVVSLSVVGHYSSRFLKCYLYFSTLFAVFFIIAISARMSLISLFILLFYFLFLKRKVLLKRSMILLLILVIGSFFMFGKNILNRFYVKESFDQTIKKAMIYEPRFTIWGCSMDIVTSDNFNYILGFGGFNNVQAALDNCYSVSIENESKRKYYLEEGFNTHNQFIDFYLVGGIIGIGLFLLFCCSLLFDMNFKVNYFEISVFVVYILFFFVENTLHRQLGCYLFGLIFLFSQENKINFNKDKA